MIDEQNYLVQIPFRIGIKFQAYSSFSDLDNNVCSIDEAYLIRAYERARTESEALRVLTKMWRQGRFCDLVLVTTNAREVLAHRLVLTLHSHKLKSYLEKFDFVTRIHLTESHSSPLINVLNYLYTGELNIKIDEFRDIVACAVELEIGGDDDGGELIETLKTYLVRNTHLFRELLDVYDASSRLKLTSLSEESFAKICQTYNEAIDSNTFVKLSQACVYALVSAKVANRNEKLVLTALMLWIYFRWDKLAKHGQARRKKQIGQLLAMIDFEKIDKTDFFKTFRKYNFVYENNSEFLDLIKNLAHFFYRDFSNF